MATQTVKLASHPGQTGTRMQLWSIDTQIMVQSASATESVFGSGLYSAAFTDAPAASYRVLHFNVDGDLIWSSCVVLTLTTATFQASDSAFGVDVLSINGSTTAAANLALSAASIVVCTVTSGASTTSIPTSASSPAGAVADQFKGRIVIFRSDTTTAALRGQATDITASSNSATPTFTVTALTTTPASGDIFVIV